VGDVLWFQKFGKKEFARLNDSLAFALLSTRVDLGSIQSLQPTMYVGNDQPSQDRIRGTTEAGEVEECHSLFSEGRSTTSSLSAFVFWSRHFQSASKVLPKTITDKKGMRLVTQTRKVRQERL
jgi:hypothetical protein